MWVLAVTSGATELLVRDRLHLAGLEVFCPYERLKTRVQVRIPRTRANPTPRTEFKVLWREVARWPRYLFTRLRSETDMVAVLNTRDVSYIVRGSEDAPAYVTDNLIDKWRADCAPDGLLLKRSELLKSTVGDLLRFVDNSPLGDQYARLTDINNLDSSGIVRVLINDRVPAVVHYSDLRQN